MYRMLKVNWSVANSFHRAQKKLSLLQCTGSFIGYITLKRSKETHTQHVHCSYKNQKCLKEIELYMYKIIIVKMYMY